MAQPHIYTGETNGTARICITKSSRPALTEHVLKVAKQNLYPHTALKGGK